MSHNSGVLDKLKVVTAEVAGEQERLSYKVEKILDHKVEDGVTKVLSSSSVLYIITIYLCIT